jgi:hypothetical protein
VRDVPTTVSSVGDLSWPSASIQFFPCLYYYSVVVVVASQTAVLVSRYSSSMPFVDIVATLGIGDCPTAIDEDSGWIAVFYPFPKGREIEPNVLLANL